VSRVTIESAYGVSSQLTSLTHKLSGTTLGDHDKAEAVEPNLVDLYTARDGTRGSRSRSAPARGSSAHRRWRS
jgi:hypothetical protein